MIMNKGTKGVDIKTTIDDVIITTGTTIIELPA